MGLKMPKGVLFDLDGTLLDSAPDFIASLDNLLERHNQPKLDPEIVRSHVSDGSWKLTSLGFNIDISDDRRGDCLLYTSPSPRDRQKSRMPSSA